MLTSQNKSKSIDVAPEGTVTDFSTHASIVDGQELLQQMGSLDAFEALERDLHVFGRAAYEAYKTDPSRVVGFKIASKITKKDTVITFEGKFGSSDNRVAVKITILKNNRITVSVLDTQTNLNIDSSLASNSKRNQFIGRLPATNNSYEIDYLKASDSFLITLYDGTNRQAAEKALADGLGVPNLSTIKYEMLIPSSAGEGEGVPAN